MKELAAELRLPLVAKDTIKDALMRVLPVPDVAASRVLGRASVAAMLAVASESPVGAVIESNLHRSRAVAQVAAILDAEARRVSRQDTLDGFIQRLKQDVVKAAERMEGKSQV